MIIGASWCLLDNYQIGCDYGISINDQRIVDIGLYSELCDQYSNDESLFCSNSIMIPSLYNLHQHFEYSAFHNCIPYNDYFPWINQLVSYKRQMTEKEKIVSYKYGLMNSISNGVGYIIDNVSSFDVCQDFYESGMNGYLMYEMTGKSGDSKSELKKYVTDNMEKYKKSCGVKIGLACHTLYTCNQKTIKNSLEVAQELDTKISIHISETRMEFDCFRGQPNLLRSEISKQRKDLLQDCSPIQFFSQKYGTLISDNTFLVHCTYMDDRDLDIINHHKARVVLCPESNLMLSHGVSPASKLINKYNNIGIGFGTDSFASCISMSLLNQAYLYYLLNNVVNPEIALNEKVCMKLLTSNAARIVDENCRGTIKVGNYADIACFELQEGFIANDYICKLITRNNSKCVLNVVNGKILFNHGRFTYFDKERVFNEIKKIRKKYTLL